MVDLTFTFIEIPNLPHIHLSGFMNHYRTIHFQVMYADDSAEDLRSKLEISNNNFQQQNSGVWDVALLMFYRDFCAADTEEKRQEFKNTFQEGIAQVYHEGICLDMPVLMEPDFKKSFIKPDRSDSKWTFEEIQLAMAEVIPFLPKEMIYSSSDEQRMITGVDCAWLDLVQKHRFYPFAMSVETCTAAVLNYAKGWFEDKSVCPENLLLIILQYFERQSCVKVVRLGREIENLIVVYKRELESGEVDLSTVFRLAQARAAL